MIKQYMKKNILKTNIMDEIIALMVDEDFIVILLVIFLIVKKE